MMDEKKVSGRSFKIASISVTMVCSSDRLTVDLPRSFVRVSLVIPISPFQNPSYHGVRLTMNFHCTARLLRCSCRIGDLNNDFNSSAADSKVEALSDTIIVGSDSRLAKPRKATIKVGTDKLSSTSTWMVRVLAHMKRQM